MDLKLLTSICTFYRGPIQVIPRWNTGILSLPRMLQTGYGLILWVKTKL